MLSIQGLHEGLCTSRPCLCLCVCVCLCVTDWFVGGRFGFGTGWGCKRLPSFDGTTSGFFSSYMSSDWLSGNEIFSLIGRLPGRLPPAVVVVAVVCCFACVARSLKAAATAIIMQISTVKMPINIPIDTIGVSSNSACGPVQKTERERGGEEEKERKRTHI